MNAIVVYESVYGNTRAIAEAVADGLGGARVLAVHEAPEVDDAELLVVGGPTHMHGLATVATRNAAAQAAVEDGVPVEPGAIAEPGVREWLRELPPVDQAYAAAFDTRLDRSRWMTGVAARGIARRLRRHGYEIVGAESFLVADSEGPLEEGELERARAWGMRLASAFAPEGGVRPSRR
jgi:flavodoxin-like protein